MSDRLVRVDYNQHGLQIMEVSPNLVSENKNLSQDTTVSFFSNKKTPSKLGMALELILRHALHPSPVAVSSAKIWWTS